MAVLNARVRRVLGVYCFIAVIAVLYTLNLVEYGAVSEHAHDRRQRARSLAELQSHQQHPADVIHVENPPQPVHNHHHHHHRQPHDVPAHQIPHVKRHKAATIPPNRMLAKNTYCVVVSNLEYLDGALVMGWSFRKQSRMLQAGTAELTAIVPDTLKSTDIEKRLKEAKWDNVIFVDDLKRLAPKAYWANTFNKIYVFKMTQFDLVAFFDVDMLILKNPDDMFFDYVLPSPMYVGALGEKPAPGFTPYFQTGMMLLRPNLAVFNDLMKIFVEDPVYKSINGRDGKLLRSYFHNRYIRLNNQLSAHKKVGAPLHEVIGFHFRGEWKPWYDVEHPKDGVEQEMGEAYRMWWQHYEEMHMELYYNEPSTAEWNPKRELWMSRHSTKEYKQLMTKLVVEARNVTYPGMTIEMSEEDESCDDACYKVRRVCREEAFSSPRINSCDALEAHFGKCSLCTMDFPHAAQPAFAVSSGKCYLNSFFMKPSRPTCAGTFDARRLCPCVEKKKLNLPPTA